MEDTGDFAGICAEIYRVLKEMRNCGFFSASSKYCRFVAAPSGDSRNFHQGNIPNIGYGYAIEINGREE